MSLCKASAVSWARFGQSWRPAHRGSFIHGCSRARRCLATATQLPQLQHDKLFGDLEGFAQDLGAACRVGDGGAGCFLISRLPGRLESLHEELLGSAREFFALPLAQKELLDYHLSPEFRGFMHQGAENTAGKVDEREQIEFGREEPRPPRSSEEPFTLYNRLRGPNLWPEQPTTLRPLITSWLGEMEELSRQLTRAIALSLGLDANALDSQFREPHVQAKLVHYPTAAKDAEGEHLGVGPHSDSGFLTLLLQDSSGGLDFLDAGGGWIEATPQPASLVCNLGEVVQLITGGLYPATVHRVRRPSVAGRLSAPFFWNPSLDVQVQPLAIAGKMPSLTGRPLASQNRMLQSYGMNAFKSLARSHPAVLARHHPDLQVLPDGQVVYR